MARYPDADILASSDHIVSTFALHLSNSHRLQTQGMRACSLKKSLSSLFFGSGGIRSITPMTLFAMFSPLQMAACACRPTPPKMTAWKGSQRQGLPATLASFCSASLPWNLPRYTLAAPCNKLTSTAIQTDHPCLASD